MPLMDRDNGVLYSNLAAYNPTNGAVLTQFAGPSGAGSVACTPFTTTQRYYCAFAFFIGSSDVLDYELWVYDLNTYAFIERVDFGTSSSASGNPSRIHGHSRQDRALGKGRSGSHHNLRCRIRAERLVPLRWIRHQPKRLAGYDQRNPRCSLHRSNRRVQPISKISPPNLLRSCRKRSLCA